MTSTKVWLSNCIRDKSIGFIRLTMQNSDPATEFFIPHDIQVEQLSPVLSRITLGPLDRGFGYTLGNALRRILLSSMPGYAITEVKLEGVSHEYDVHEGIREDVIDLLLNLKQVAIRLPDSAEAELSLDVSGGKKGGEVRAGDLQLPAAAEIANPDLIIAHLNRTGSLKGQLKAERGRGYVPKQSRRRDQEETRRLGVMHLDASFSPISRVAYSVQDTRLGNRTDLDLLVMELETNGTIGAEEAIRRAATILHQHLSPLVEPNAGSGRIVAEVEEPRLDPLLTEPLEKLSLSLRTLNSLKREQITMVGELVQLNERDLFKIPSVGKVTIKEINEKLTEKGLELGSEVAGWPTALQR